MRFKHHQNLSCLLGSFFVAIFFSASTWALPSASPASTDNLQVYLEQIMGEQGNRHYKNIEELQRVSAWIKEQMRLFGIPCQYQNYSVNGSGYRNVVCTLTAGHADKVIVGAHYDVFGETQGADDNASGVAGVIETARILAQQKSQLAHNVDFVFYTLAEPPFFKTEQMGSFVHAKSVQAQKEQIQGVYILEMIGYFDEKLVQEYPAGLKWVYPQHGNFIAAVSNLQSYDLGAKYCQAMRMLDRLECQRLVAPSFISAMEVSDHLNYWKFGIPAMMITDTAFFRNKHYHTAADTLKTLNIGKMANVIDGLVYSLLLQADE
ncbi:peptidase M28 [Acinetobacter sp. ANC 4169]|uniref:M28 family peptidase n=1 Tax=Acinetobacter sp. ANC 4169 TaxID=1977879 RepID=UPI000A3386E8|nr:M28 family peptidase [Acinetobacter sp. ANC 4169]OTG75390.1 peptidase M28 [Acinetobacter sp. ANC 4169]